MTTVEKFHLFAFRNTLRSSGVVCIFGAASFKCTLTRPKRPVNSQPHLTENPERDYEVTVPTVDLPPLVPVKGDDLLVAGSHYRVVRVLPTPGNVLTSFQIVAA